MWTGGRTIRGLRLFRDGLTYAESFRGVPPDRRRGGFAWERFGAGIPSRHNPGQLNVDTFWLAAEAAGSDAAGFDRWFDRYDEFNPDPAPDRR